MNGSLENLQNIRPLISRFRFSGKINGVCDSSVRTGRTDKIIDRTKAFVRIIFLNADSERRTNYKRTHGHDLRVVCKHVFISIEKENEFDRIFRTKCFRILCGSPRVEIKLLFLSVRIRDTPACKGYEKSLHIRRTRPSSPPRHKR